MQPFKIDAGSDEKQLYDYDYDCIQGWGWEACTRTHSIAYNNAQIKLSILNSYNDYDYDYD